MTLILTTSGGTLWLTYCPIGARCSDTPKVGLMWSRLNFHASALLESCAIWRTGSRAGKLPILLGRFDAG
jgi:hypothetical protein